MPKDEYSIIRKTVTDISIVKYPIISFLFCIILITGSAAAFAGGDGSVESPYQISNVNELQNIQNDLDANYILINNIDASVTSEWNDGAGFEPIGDYDYRFTGSLDGNNYTIFDLFINRPFSEYVGLFGCTRKNNKIIISYLGLNNINVSGNTYVGGLVGCNRESIIYQSHTTGNVIGNADYVGGLVGENSQGEIYNSYAAGNVTGYDSEVGGLIGRNLNGVIYNSYATGNVTGSYIRVGGLIGYNYVSIINQSYAAGNVTGNSDYVGGLVGYNYESITNQSYATGNVIGNADYVGGLVGENSQGEIYNSYAAGNVTGHWYIGGLIGSSDSGSTIKNSYSIGNLNGNDYYGGLIGGNFGSVISSYYNKETSGQSDTGKGIPKTTIEMKQQSTYTNWDFDNAWFIHASINDGYPQLHNFISAYPPVSDFTSNVTSGVVPPLSVKFTDLSSKEPTQWLWDFGDGNTSTEQNPTHTYTNYGNYNVSLTAINDVADDTETKIDYIAIDENIICMAKSIGFNDSSAVEDSTLTIPLELLNVSNGPIQTIKCDIQYNESILSLESIGSGNLTSGWTVSKGINGYSITLTTSDSELTIQNESSGDICNLTFSVIGKSGESTELTPWNVDLANTANLHGYASSKNGIFTVETPGRLSGNVSYNFNGTSIENVDVSFMQSGNLIDKNTTNTSGYYIFTNIEPGTYNIIFDKAGFYSEEISVQTSAGSDIYRDSNMIITGDLDGNGISADAVDVNMMMQASVGNLASNRYFDLDKNEEFADAVDVNMMIQASVGDIVLE
ncbi:PKD domain-containing protein [Methanohalophilus sp. RSK]|uniref:GLUG motif-containing protein n=1 Tax=Methanohalophilus sp. RSK TaxID=2485783 RepID=UPI000F4394C6|nr:GLUG motif-containing protein [Methanohalophilus sp. RSK]RNI12942.1 PKD domain-containing protein [Methanohalophilus sp. RSK]